MSSGSKVRCIPLCRQRRTMLQTIRALTLLYLTEQIRDNQPTKTDIIMDEKNTVLEAMRKAGEPVNAGKIAELTGLDRKVVDKAMAALKKEGAIVSPVRCKWTPA